ncbi:MAG: hypothetical protein JW769_04595 [Parachlamydiales bacterium]|nr:hypothetical protein [Parachlamydiales bacterium]
MSSILSLLQGTNTGCAATYLHEKTQNESPQWFHTALQVNHLLFLTAETLAFANISLGLFGVFVRTVFILSPLVLIADLTHKHIHSFSP